ncbi:MAG: hypothetical protein ACU84H_01485 [Gammaproteobacteria bacterium]
MTEFNSNDLETWEPPYVCYLGTERADNQSKLASRTRGNLPINLTGFGLAGSCPIAFFDLKTEGVVGHTGIARFVGTAAISFRIQRSLFKHLLNYWVAELG